MGKKNKKGWIRIAEAFAAVLLIMGAAIIVVSEGIQEDDIFKEVYDFEMSILKELNMKYGIEYTAQTRADSIVKKPEQLRIMKASGIISLTIGAESASQKVLDAMNKISNYGYVPQALNLIKDTGIEAGTYWLIGHPGSSRIEEEKTKKAIEDLLERDLCNYYEVKLFLPFPGTKSSKDSRISSFDSNFSNFKFDTKTPVHSLTDFPADEIEKTFLEITEILHNHGKSNVILKKEVA